MLTVLRQEALDGTACYVVPRRDAEEDGQLVFRVILLERRREAFVEVGFPALARPDYGNVRYFIVRQLA